MGIEQKKGEKGDIIPTQHHEMAEEGWVVSWELRASATLLCCLVLCHLCPLLCGEIRTLRGFGEMWV